MGKLKTAVISLIGTLAAAITCVGAYVSFNCNCSGSEEDIPPAPAPIESVDFDFSGTEPDNRPAKRSETLEEWVAECDRTGLYDSSEACVTWGGVFFPNKVMVDEVGAYFKATGQRNPLRVLKLHKAGVDPDVVADFRRFEITDINWMSEMVSACYRGSCKVAASGEVTGDDPDESAPAGKASEFSARCENTGIDDLGVCVEYALAGTSPSKAEGCRREGIDDPLICLRMLQRNIPASRMKTFLDTWNLDVERPGCEPEVFEGEDPSKVRRERNMYAMFRYAVSKADIADRMMKNIPFPSVDTAVPAGKAWAYHLACIPADEGVKLHIYGVPADYAVDMFTKGRAVFGSSVISAWYSCISLDDVLVELAAENAVRRAHAKGPDDYERAYLRDALQRLAQKTDGYLVRHLFQYVDVGCEGRGFCDQRGCDMIHEAIELGLTQEESEQLYEDGTRTLAGMIEYKRQHSPLEGTGGFITENPFGEAPGEGGSLKQNSFDPHPGQEDPATE